MRRLPLLPALLVLLAPALAPALAAAAPPMDAATAKALDEIWAMEAKIYAGRAAGTMQPYVEAASKNMLT